MCAHIRLFGPDTESLKTSKPRKLQAKLAVENMKMFHTNYIIQRMYGTKKTYKI